MATARKKPGNAQANAEEQAGATSDANADANPADETAPANPDNQADETANDNPDDQADQTTNDNPNDEDVVTVDSSEGAAALLLTGAENPGGWKLEELLEAIIFEIETHKQPKLDGDTRYEANRVRAGNEEICRHLRHAAMVQRENMAVVSRLGPNNGPEGEPRIGRGSPGMADSESD